MKDAVAIVIKKKGKFLMIKRAKKGEAEDYWCPITGAVEEGEQQEQAVVREAKEEMGVTVEPIRKVWVCPTEDEEYLLHWWYVKLKDNKIKMNRDEVKEFSWVDCAEMEKIGKTFPADRKFFREIGINLDDSVDEEAT